MESLLKLRRRVLVKQESISRIARDLNLARNTVKKYLKTETEPVYQRNHQPCPKLGTYRQQLETWLEQDGQRPKGQRRTARRLFEDLQREGYAGAYDSVQRFVKQWKGKAPTPACDANVPLSFPPGETCQFDWSHEQVELGGVVQTVKLAHFRLAHSRQLFLAAYPRETQEMVFDAHNRAFAFLGGVTGRMVYDNPKTIVQAIRTGKERQFNRRFLALANHYLFEPVACTPAAGWEKGQVENQVGNIREWLFTPRPAFPDFAELNAWLETRCRELAKRAHPEQKDRAIAEVFAGEQGHLRPFTAPFDGYFEQPCRVSLRAWADRIGVVAEGRLIAEHVRCFGRERLICDPWHYLPVLEKKPGALRHGAPFQDWKLPGPLLAVKEWLLKQSQGDRAFVDVLLALREHGTQILTVACELALEHRTVTAPVILNHVARLVAPPPPLPLVATTLVLKAAPAANCARYDALRGRSPR